MEVVNPLSLLEVMMDNSDEDCIVIDDDEITIESGGGRYDDINIVEEVMEVEVDPLYIPSGELPNPDNNKKDMISLWVNTNINNLATPSSAEIKYREKKYKNIYGILKERLHCTICSDHIGCDIRIHSNSIEHPVLKVLVCERCLIAYRSVKFIFNEKGKEVACRWCGKIPSSWSVTILRSCHQCPFSFCEACLGKNCPHYSEPQLPWICIACNIVALWGPRASLWALHTIKNLLLSCPPSTLAKVNQDISSCCRKKRFKRNQAIEKRCGKISDMLDPIDIKKLVQPLIPNGSTSSEFQIGTLPEPEPLFFFSEFFSENINGKEKVAAKQKPKSKPKRKSAAKPLKQASLKENPVPLKPVPHKDQEEMKNPETNSNSMDMKSNWLRTKLHGYNADFEKLRTKLKEIEESLTDSESVTDEKIDAVSTLLSLHGDLLNSCRLNLINEWKEMKARAVLENFNTNKTEVIEKSKPSSKTNAKTFNQNKKSCKDNGGSGNNSSKKKNDSIKFNGVSLEENKHYILKNCCVRLPKLNIPLPVVDKNCIIKLERINPIEEKD